MPAHPLVPVTVGPTRNDKTTRYIVAMTVLAEAATAQRPLHQFFLQGVSSTTTSHDAAPQSCHARCGGDNRLCWQTLGQTCSRGDPGSAICVQRLDDSLNSAIHTRYRSLLRSSSMHEPRDPPSEVVKFSNQRTIPKTTQGFKKVTQKTKDGRTQFEARQAVHIDSHRFKCVTRFNAGSTPPMNRAETLPSPVAGARCFTIPARSNNG